MTERHRAMPWGHSLTAVALAVFVAGCQSEPAVHESADSEDPREAHAAASGTAPANLPLKAIMQGLDADMAAVARALWLEDPSGVGAAATRVADHPRVTPDQMAAIQATLGPDFSAFVEYDHAVHEAAVALAAAAAEGATPTELLAGVVSIQEGCVNCHTAFRARVSAALVATGG